MVDLLGAGDLVGGYTVRGLLFRAPLFEAYSAVDQRSAAVCLLCSAREGRPSPSDEDFARDLAILRSVTNRDMPRVLSGGQTEELSFIATQSIGGTEPFWSPGERPLHWLRALMTAQRVIGVLKALEAEGVYHGSLNLQCIRRWRDGHVSVVGAGTARMFGLDDETIRASPRYFAPEQMQRSPAPADGKSDIYSLGMCLHAAISGYEPFEGATEEQLLTLAQHGHPPISLRDEIPNDVWTYIKLCTQKDPSRRHDWENASVVLRVVIDGCVEEKADFPGMQEVIDECALDLVAQMGPDTRRKLTALACAPASSEPTSSEPESAPSDADSGRPADPRPAEPSAAIEFVAQQHAANDAITVPLADPLPDTKRTPVRVAPPSPLGSRSPEALSAPAPSRGKALRLRALLVIAATFAGSGLVLATTFVALLVEGSRARDSLRAVPLLNVVVLPTLEREVSPPPTPLEASPRSGEALKQRAPRKADQRALPWAGVACSNEFLECSPLSPE